MLMLGTHLGCSRSWSPAKGKGLGSLSCPVWTARLFLAHASLPSLPLQSRTVFFSGQSSQPLA